MNDENYSKNKILIAYCGLNCGECDMYLAPTNSNIANRLVKVFHGSWENVKAEDFHCGTCRGPIKDCWTEDCWIRNCCINNKKVNYCYECNEFPCIKLDDWAKKNERYQEALIKLREIKKKENSKKEVT